MTTMHERARDDLLAAGARVAELLEEWRPPGLTALERAGEITRRRRVLEEWDRAVGFAHYAAGEVDHAAS